jgi:hypothetical protein
MASSIQVKRRRCLSDVAASKICRLERADGHHLAVAGLRAVRRTPRCSARRSAVLPAASAAPPRTRRLTRRPRRPSRKRAFHVQSRRSSTSSRCPTTTALIARSSRACGPAQAGRARARDVLRDVSAIQSVHRIGTVEEKTRSSSFGRPRREPVVRGVGGRIDLLEAGPIEASRSASTSTPSRWAKRTGSSTRCRAAPPPPRRQRAHAPTTEATQGMANALR